jgi:hypothetical protein
VKIVSDMEIEILWYGNWESKSNFFQDTFYPQYKKGEYSTLLIHIFFVDGQTITARKQPHGAVQCTQILWRENIA